MSISKQKWVFVVALSVGLSTISGCFVQPGTQTNPPTSPTTTSSSTPVAISPPKTGLSGSSSYTPYDAIGMLWSKKDKKNHSMIWTNSGGESGKLLVSKAAPDKRPDWILCTQGVVAGLASKGEEPVIIGSVFVSDQSILPIFRKPKKSLVGGRTLPIPRSSIEFALDRLVKREGVSLNSIKIPKVEKPSFPTITTLLTKPASEKDALDFAVLVEPFITNVMTKYPNQYEIGKGGLYKMHYSIVVRKSDLQARRPEFVKLLKELLEADKQIAAFPDDKSFYQQVWGREKDGKPELFPKTLTYQRSPAKLQLQVGTLRKQLKEEISYLTQKYPADLRMPANIDTLVDDSLLQEVAPDRVIP